jgi:hypothetical protein
MADKPAWRGYFRALHDNLTVAAASKKTHPRP